MLDGGSGVGRVTKKGLEQPVGNAAINKIPRSMILKAVEDVCSEYDYEGGLEIIISVPGGRRQQKNLQP
ncbi:MAG: cobalt-precorrin-5B (C(1))-methyltransferase [Blautia marasmi]